MYNNGIIYAVLLTTPLTPRYKYHRYVFRWTVIVLLYFPPSAYISKSSIYEFLLERKDSRLTKVDFRKDIISKPDGSIVTLFLYFINNITKKNVMLKMKEIYYWDCL